MDGVAWLEALETVRPEMVPRVVFATGDVLGERTREFFARIENQALIKPFQVEDLLEALGRAAQH